MWERTDFIYFFHVVSCSCMLKLLKQCLSGVLISVVKWGECFFAVESCWRTFSIPYYCINSVSGIVQLFPNLWVLIISGIQGRSSWLRCKHTNSLLKHLIFTCVSGTNCTNLFFQAEEEDEAGDAEGEDSDAETKADTADDEDEVHVGFLSPEMMWNLNCVIGCALINFPCLIFVCRMSCDEEALLPATQSRDKAWHQVLVIFFLIIRSCRSPFV